VVPKTLLIILVHLVLCSLKSLAATMSPNTLWQRVPKWSTGKIEQCTAINKLRLTSASWTFIDGGLQKLVKLLELDNNCVAEMCFEVLECCLMSYNLAFTSVLQYRNHPLQSSLSNAINQSLNNAFCNYSLRNFCVYWGLPILNLIQLACTKKLNKTKNVERINDILCELCSLLFL